MQRHFSSTILRHGIRLFACCLLVKGGTLHAQNTAWAISTSAPPPDGTNATFQTSGQVFSGEIGSAGCVINGIDIGTILLKTFDLNHDGKVTLAELKQVADGCFKLWDTNNVGSLTQTQLADQLKQFFPNFGLRTAVRIVNGVAVQVPPDQLPTPSGQLANHIFAYADSNKDGFLSLQELNDFLDKSFNQWDQNGDGSLDAQELGTAFGILAMPDPPQ